MASVRAETTTLSQDSAEPAEHPLGSLPPVIASLTARHPSRQHERARLPSIAIVPRRLLRRPALGDSELVGKAGCASSVESESIFGKRSRMSEGLPSGACWPALVRLTPGGVGFCNRRGAAVWSAPARRLLRLLKTSVCVSLLLLGECKRGDSSADRLQASVRCDGQLAVRCPRPAPRSCLLASTCWLAFSASAGVVVVRAANPAALGP